MKSRGMKRTTSELVNPMTNPSFPFAAYSAGFSVLLLWELWKLSNDEIPYVLGVPMSIMCFGGKLYLMIFFHAKKYRMLMGAKASAYILRHPFQIPWCLIGYAWIPARICRSLSEVRCLDKLHCTLTMASMQICPQRNQAHLLFL